MIDDENSSRAVAVERALRAGRARIAAGAMSVDLFQMADHILQRIAVHQDGPATDDKTLIVVEVK